MLFSRPGLAPALLALLGATLLGASPAHASLFPSSTSSTVAPLGGVNFAYSYTVTLASFSSPLSELDVTLSGGGPTGALLSNITMPTGFQSLYTPGATSIQFRSTSPASDLLAGATGTFSFTSLSVPLTQPIVYRADDGSAPVVSRGYAPGPLAAAVPEAPCGALFALGLLPVGLLIARKRKAA